MAESPSHRFGQVVGNLLEEILQPELLRFCDERGLYLDRHGARLNVRKGRKVAWEDRYGNSHDLDFVIEKDGSAEKRGRPVAFIEAAWRRYTKHSKAKAQEIQGAVLPIAEKYEIETPFLGAVLAGQFTGPSLSQLRSLGFHIVHLSYEDVVAAFAAVGIDARFDEDTPDREFRDCVAMIEALSTAERSVVKDVILTSGRDQFDTFFARLRRKLDRVVDRIVILPLFGNAIAFAGVGQAIDFLGHFDPTVSTGAFHKYDVTVSFSNADRVSGTFADAEEAARFLHAVTS